MITKLLSLASAVSYAAGYITETAIPPDCILLNGYDLTKGCLSPAVETPPDCPSDQSLMGGDPCVFTDKSIHSETSYLRMMSSSNDQKDMFSTVTTAEGGGWGVKVSASVGFMNES